MSPILDFCIFELSLFFDYADISYDMDQSCTFPEITKNKNLILIKISVHMASIKHFLYLTVVIFMTD